MAQLIASSVWNVWHAHPEASGLSTDAMAQLRAVIRSYLEDAVVETRLTGDGSQVWVMRESGEVPDLFGINVAREITHRMAGHAGFRHRLERIAGEFPPAINETVAGLRR